MKEWRTREADAGRPASFADLCRAFGLCVTFLGEGVTRNDNDVGFRSSAWMAKPNYSSDARSCGGAGMLRTS